MASRMTALARHQAISSLHLHSMVRQFYPVEFSSLPLAIVNPYVFQDPPTDNATGYQSRKSRCDQAKCVLVQREMEFRFSRVSESRGRPADESRHPAAKVYRMVQIPKEGGRQANSPPVLRSLPLSRRSGRTSALPYPPLRSSSVVVRC